jgi:hypothetical protein
MISPSMASIENRWRDAKLQVAVAQTAVRTWMRKQGLQLQRKSALDRMGEIQGTKFVYEFRTTES